MTELTPKKLALVTGGSSGIGLGIVKMCLQKGYTTSFCHVQNISVRPNYTRIPVFIVSGSMPDQITPKLESELSDIKVPWIYHRADIKSWEEQESAFQHAVTWSKEQGGRFWYVFANAGIGEKKWLELPKDISSNTRGFHKPNFEVILLHVCCPPTDWM
jgi:NAD(P)-dependent dehydrogenase (short-subunit alcohol dehydrogenase family)